jgi:hypothetical protein
MQLFRQAPCYFSKPQGYSDPCSLSTVYEVQFGSLMYLGIPLNYKFTTIVLMNFFTSLVRRLGTWNLGWVKQVLPG